MLHFAHCGGGDAKASAIDQTVVVSTMGDYGAALGTMRTVRWFTDMDAANPASTVVVVNESFATRAWPGQNPIGKQLRLHIDRKPGAWLTVTGLIGDVAQREREVHRTVVYVPYAHLPEPSVGLVIHTATSPAAVIDEVRRIMRAVDPDLPVIDLDTFENRFRISHWPARIFGALFTLFGAVALLLAAIGLFGVTSHSVTQRTHEIGLRVALGATTANVLREIFSGATRQVLLGLTFGLLAASGLTRLLASQLVDVSPHDPLTFAAVTGVLFLVGVAGCLVPARRALRVNPVTALRHE
ncbi:MAG: FtsX-like permease family protein [Vicinamibacterales bacterium]